MSLLLPGKRLPPDRQRIDRLWAEEAEARLAAYDRGEMRAIPAAEVFEGIGAKRK
ncbi:MAG: addiction module protein [Thermodesulfobacteriota bacterium]